MRNSVLKKLAMFFAVIMVVTMIPVTAFAQSDAVDKPPVPPKAVKEEKQQEETPEEKKERDALKIVENDVAALYRAQSGTFLVTPILTSHENNQLFYGTLKSLDNNASKKKFEWDHDEASEYNEGSFLAVLKDGSRVIYSLVKNNRIQAGEHYYQIPAEDYNRLLNIYNTDYKLASYAQWLIYMQPNKITGVAVQGYNDKELVDLDPQYVRDAVMKVRALRTVKGDYYFPIKEDFNPGNGSTAKIRLTFGTDDPTKEDGHYYLWIIGDKLYIQTSDLRFGVEHTLAKGDGAKLISILKNPAENLKAATIKETK